jgi:hypothetical protein
LRVNRAVLQRLDDRALNFRGGAPVRLDGAGIGDGDVAVVVDGLVRNDDIVAGPNTG